jgi:hypothetical protein
MVLLTTAISHFIVILN